MKLILSALLMVLITTPALAQTSNSMPSTMLTPSLARNAEAFRSDTTELKLKADTESIQPGTAFKIFMDFNLAQGWHTYADPPGDSGLPVRVAWTLPPDFEASAIEWLPVNTYEDFGFTTYGYSGNISLPVIITPPKNMSSNHVTLKAKIDWMVCKDTCIPETAELALILPVGVDINR